MLSEKFFIALSELGKPYHKIAWEAGLTPNQLYKITARIDRPGPADPRVEALCNYIGISLDDAFENLALDTGN